MKQIYWLMFAQALAVAVLQGGMIVAVEVAPFTGTAAAADVPPLRLRATLDMPDHAAAAARWRPGWRDEGTADTRPQVRRGDGPSGGDALVLDVRVPNSSEYVDYRLGADEHGRVWRQRGYDHIAFWVRSDVDGDMDIRLNQGDIRWKQGGPCFRARFWVEAGAWRQVILPFTAFVDKVPLHDPSIIDTLSIGYGNNHLRAAGQITVAGIQVGRMGMAVAVRPISLEGLWRFMLDDRRPDGSRSDFTDQRDREGYGAALGFHAPGYDDTAWTTISIGTHWERQGHPRYDGPAWFRQRVLIPEAWRGRPLSLCLGKPDDRGELYWNGEQVAQIPRFGEPFSPTLRPDQVVYGGLNTIAVRVVDWYDKGGLIAGPFSVGPEIERIAVGIGGQPASAPEVCEMGPVFRPGRGMTWTMRFMGQISERADLRVSYRMLDCFHRTIASGEIPAARTADGEIEARIVLDDAQHRDVHYGEWIDLIGTLLDGEGMPLTAFARYGMRLSYAERDALALPELPATYEDTPLGRLKLIDVIDASTDPDRGIHPYKEGGVRAFWGGRRAYDPARRGVAVKRFMDREYREATNNQHFGYRIGRGAMKPGTHYVLRLLYPEDASRYVAIDIKAGRNYQGVGFRTGVDPSLVADEPVTPYPLSGRYQWSDHIVSLDDITYGFRGKRSATSAHGFWVFFHDIGRVYAPQYDAGPAIAEMRLYEIESPPQHEPRIHYPDGLRRRVLMMDWERQPEADPVATTAYARLIGLNALSPVFLKWSFNGYFTNSQGYDGAPEWYGTPPHRDGFGNQNCWRILGEWLDATKQGDVALIPRLEYGGSPRLPAEARVIGPDGKQDPCGRYTPWGANLLHPATWDDIKTLLDEVVGAHVARYPNIGGVLWRMRSDRVKCSYGQHDVALFCRETGRQMPTGDAAALARWASRTMGEEYHAWWHLKRRDFHVRIRDQLRSYRPDLKLYYYNWDPDGWSLATGGNQGNTPQDWTDMYNVNAARGWYLRKIAEQKRLGDDDYVRRLFGGHVRTNQPHTLLKADLYRDIDGIALFLPVHWHYLSNNAPYVQSFATGDGLAVCNQYFYEEKGRTNIQGDNYETSEMTPAGPDFSMAEEVLSVFHGDPNVITWTPYTIGRSFIAEHRRFAQAFLALPDMRGEVVDHFLAAPDPDIRVRAYRTVNGIYMAVVHRGFAPTHANIRLPVDGSAAVTDLVTGESVVIQPHAAGSAYAVSLAPMSLRSFLVRPAAAR